MDSLGTKINIGGIAVNSADPSDKQLDDIMRAPELGRYVASNPDEVVEHFKSFLKDVLISRMTYFNPIMRGISSPKPDPTLWIQETRQYSAQYLTSTWMHNPWLTKYFISELLSCQLEGLNYRASTGFYPDYGFRNLQEPYGTILSVIAGLVFFIALFSLLFYLVDRDRQSWAFLLIVYIVYHYSLKARQAFFRAKMRSKVSDQIEFFSILQYEVYIDAYDPDVVSRRLESIESKGIFPFSIIFPLLRMRKADLSSPTT
ncbi:MAG: PDGLE domain-containing protein [Nitrospira sp.]|nr:PDGLE domain-containing protein [Nitrospira sp.]